MAGIKICRAGSVVKNITSKATEAEGVAVKTVAAAKNELANAGRSQGNLGANIQDGSVVGSILSNVHSDRSKKPQRYFGNALVLDRL
jgi:hypothetical protein